jgi:hypothetical protein
MAEEWKLEETEKDAHGRPTGPVRRAFEAWCREAGIQINRSRTPATQPAYRARHGEFPYVGSATRAAWRAWQGAVAAVAPKALGPDSLRFALAMAVLKGDEAAAGALVDLLLEAGVGAGRKGEKP